MESKDSHERPQPSDGHVEDGGEQPLAHTAPSRALIGSMPAKELKALFHRDQMF